MLYLQMISKLHVVSTNKSDILEKALFHFWRKLAKNTFIFYGDTRLCKERTSLHALKQGY